MKVLDSLPLLLQILSSHLLLFGTLNIKQVFSSVETNK